MEHSGTAYTGRSSLTVRIAGGGFSFSLYDPASEEGFRFQPYEINPTVSIVANVKEAMRNEAVLKDTYHKVNFLFTGETVLLPSEFFNEEDYPHYFRFQYPALDNYEVEYNRLSHTGNVLLFPVERGLKKLLVDEYPNVAFYSVLSSITEHFCGLSRFGNNRKLYLYFYDGKLCAEVFDKGRLEFMNEFRWDSEVSNVLYYVTCIWKACQLDVEEDRLYVAGDVGGAKSSLLEQLRRFYRNVCCINPAAEFNEASVSRGEDVPYDVQSLLVYGI